MRQRVLKNKEEIKEEYKEFLITDPIAMKGKWNQLFSEGKIYMEIGSGKGRFISETALVHPENNYLACEGGANIYPRILQKIGAKNIKNLKVIGEYIIDPKDCFQPGELAGVYINFCDPWPKDRHAHRRLTHVNKLLSYKEILLPGSVLEFKTDNDDLFEFSLEQVKLAGLKADYITRDLHNSELADTNIQTEYEEKFSSNGKTINYLRIIF